jgi:hypothetical protein
MILYRPKVYSAYDRAWILWSICLLDWLRENNISANNRNIKNIFGEEIWRKFMIYIGIGIKAKFVNSDFGLTSPGMRLAKQWRQEFNDY